jgi:SAM-dependent methyltransferase
MREAFDAVFAALAESRLVARALAHAAGNEYPADAEPLSLVTRAELDAIWEALALEPDGLLADLGCGTGGPGLFVARAARARLVGIDISPVAVGEAAARAAAWGLGERASFRTGMLERTGLEDASVDGVMSVDSLWLASSHDLAAQEIARILFPGGRLVATTWEGRALPPDLPQPPRSAADVLRGAGLDVLHVSETRGWRARQQSFYDWLIAHESQLRAELPAAAAANLLSQAEAMPAFLGRLRRVLVVAQRPERPGA